MESFRHPHIESPHIPQRETEKGHNKKAANVFMTFFASFSLFFLAFFLFLGPVPRRILGDSYNVDTSEDISYSMAGHEGLWTICLRHSFAV